MKTVYLFFAARRYWKDDAVLQAAYRELSALAGDAEHHLITDTDPDVEAAADCAVLIPMSGAVQRRLMDTAARYDSAVLYAAYIRGNASPAVCEEMLRNNAAPSIMDVWGTLRRTHPRAELVLNADALAETLTVLSAYHHVRGATLLQIGATEPWVVSNASAPDVYTERFGVKIIPVAQSELEELYNTVEVNDKNLRLWYRWFSEGAVGCVEPTDEDITNACRMAAALAALLNKYNADGAALACFNLLRTGTTACLGVSFLNDCTGKVVACEGDMDSAVTMLLMKKLTATRLWMANPGLQPDGSINFSHCTAPIHCTDRPLHFKLRDHHESGIGVSLQVEYPIGQTVTACRISDEARCMTIHRGVSQTGPYETTCRTQMHVRFDQPEHYLQTALGCHQVFAFEDICSRLEKLAGMFGLKVL